MTKIDKIEATWKKGMAFEVIQPGGSIKIDASKELGGEGDGVLPKAMMLSAIAGCTGMDVTSLMKKMRIDDSVDDFKISIEGSLSKDHPVKYTDVTIVYSFVGKELDKAKLEKAVNLSIDRYCGVYDMFRSFANITSKIVYVES